MSRRIPDLHEPGSLSVSTNLSRRDFLGNMGRLGFILPVSSLLTELPWLQALQKPTATTRRSTATNSAAVMGFLFKDIARESGLAAAVNVFGGVERKEYIIEETGCGVALFDYDNDGWLDIFMVNGTRLEGISASHPPTNFLFHNNRDGTFTDVTEKAGLARSGWGQGCCIGDYDNDGFDDLVVTCWGGLVLYHNNGDGTFTEVTEKAGLVQKDPHPRWNTGCCFVDYDRDGHLDLFVANYVNFDLKTTPVAGKNAYCRYFGLSVGCGPQGMGGGTNFFYRNGGDCTFQYGSLPCVIAVPRGPSESLFVSDQWIPTGSYGLGVSAADFDNSVWPG